MKDKFSISKRLQSFSHAFDGIKVLLKEEHNARVHVVLALTVVLAGFYFKIEPFEWMFIVLCIALVLSLEIVNSSIERMADFISPDKHKAIKHIKDLAAAAVLLSAIASIVVAAIILIPRIIMP